MKQWDKILHDFGQVIHGETVKTIFEYLGSKKIVKIKASCGCIVAGRKANKITVSLRVKELPDYRQSMEHDKKITVIFEDFTREILVMKALAVKKFKING